MKILIADSHVKQVGRALAQAFSGLGHECRLLVDDKGLYFSGYRVLAASPFRKSVRGALMAHKRRAGAMLRKAATEFRPDIVVVIQGDYFLKADIAAIIKDHEVVVANWIIHDPALSEFYDLLRLGELAGYSHLFIADELWLPGVYFFETPVTHLPLAGDECSFRPTGAEKDIDIFFAGDLFPSSPGKTSGLVHARVLEGLLANGFKVHASVSGKEAMQKFVPTLKRLTVLDGRQTPKALNALYNRSKIVLTLFPLDYKKDAAENFFNAAFAKAFQLVEQKGNIEKTFGKSVAMFRSQQELIHLVRRYAGDTAARAVSAAALYDEVCRSHSYRDRAEKLLSSVGLLRH